MERLRPPERTRDRTNDRPSATTAAESRIATPEAPAPPRPAVASPMYTPRPSVSGDGSASAELPPPPSRAPVISPQASWAQRLGRRSVVAPEAPTPSSSAPAQPRLTLPCMATQPPSAAAAMPRVMPGNQPPSPGGPGGAATSPTGSPLCLRASQTAAGVPSAPQPALRSYESRSLPSMFVLPAASPRMVNTSTGLPARAEEAAAGVVLGYRGSEGGAVGSLSNALRAARSRMLLGTGSGSSTRLQGRVVPVSAPLEP
jgi:hypothetical protein